MVTELSASREIAFQDILMGGMPKTVPDFSKGSWLKRQRKDVIEFVQK